MKSVVLYSGGMDSTVALELARRESREVYALFVDYGQTHDNEYVAAQELIARLNSRLNMHLTVASFHLPIDSNLLRGRSAVMPEGFSQYYVPNRNAILLSLMHAYGQSVKADVAWMGACGADSAEFPDCREDNLRSYWASFENTSTKSTMTLNLPIINLTKAETFEFAAELGILQIVQKHTRTCYLGDRTEHEWGYGCGQCPACNARSNGWMIFKEKR